jgi:maltooligosyltrehalose trehalohydrolase
MRKPEIATTKLGSAPIADSNWSFLVWAPKANRVDVHVSSPANIIEPLRQIESGYFYGEISPLQAGAWYKYRLNDAIELPDPASTYQPEGVHGPSELTSPDFNWTDHDWRGIPLAEYVLYELHIGTFTHGGTFDAAIEQFDYLWDLGVTAIEIMPVAQFPGERNWGYDGVYAYAVQASYGGPAGLKRFVDAAHGKGIAVVLDVVYNHFGPEGNYLGRFGDYFTDEYSTPWGRAVNFDDTNSAGVRRFVVENAARWVSEFHIDALRLDAVHAIFDASDPHILRDVTDAIHHSAGNRLVYAIAESNLNDTRILKAAAEDGYGFDAQWNDDFHHSIHSILTGERSGYYVDFGEVRHLAKAFAEGFVYSGQFSRYRGKTHGTTSKDFPAYRFVNFTQNHDQVGNRLLGERLNQLIVREDLQLAAAALILSPFLPMLFMGQEYGERAPFLYFVSHSDSDLIEAVRTGRRKEFKSFEWHGEQPDPQAETTFLRSKLNHDLRNHAQHRAIHDFYRELLRLRKSTPPLRNPRYQDCAVHFIEETGVIAVRRWQASQQALTIMNFGQAATDVELPAPPGVWSRELDSAQTKWFGPGTTLSDEIISNGNIALRLTPRSVCLLVLRSAC